MTEHVHILTTGGTIAVNLTETIGDGRLDDSDCETTGDAINAVKRAIHDGNALLVNVMPFHGGANRDETALALIEPGPHLLAYTYRRKD